MFWGVLQRELDIAGPRGSWPHAMSSLASDGISSAISSCGCRLGMAIACPVSENGGRRGTLSPYSGPRAKRPDAPPVDLTGQWRRARRRPPTTALGLVHVRVGLGEQLVDRPRLQWVPNADANAHGDAVRAVGGLAEMCELALQAIAEQRRMLRHGVDGEHDELVAPEAGEDVGVAKGRPQHVRGVAEHAIARGMAEQIVDRLHSVDVDKQQKRRSARSRRKAQPLLGQRREATAVVEPVSSSRLDSSARRSRARSRSVTSRKPQKWPRDPGDVDGHVVALEDASVGHVDSVGEDLGALLHSLLAHVEEPLDVEDPRRAPWVSRRRAEDRLGPGNVEHVAKRTIDELDPARRVFEEDARAHAVHQRPKLRRHRLLLRDVTLVALRGLRDVSHEGDGARSTVGRRRGPSRDAHDAGPSACPAHAQLDLVACLARERSPERRLRRVELSAVDRANRVGCGPPRRG